MGPFHFPPLFTTDVDEPQPEPVDLPVHYCPKCGTEMFRIISPKLTAHGTTSIRHRCEVCEPFFPVRIQVADFGFRYRSKYGYDEDDPGFENSVRAIEDGINE